MELSGVRFPGSASPWPELSSDKQTASSPGNGEAQDATTSDCVATEAGLLVGRLEFELLPPPHEASAESPTRATKRNIRDFIRSLLATMNISKVNQRLICTLDRTTTA